MADSGNRRRKPQEDFIIMITSVFAGSIDGGGGK
jgi:hypothetical protein